MTGQRCLFCGGDASEPDHRAHCDGRQGAIEADAGPTLYARRSHPDTSHAAAAAYDPERLQSGIDHAVWLHRTRGPMADYEYVNAWHATWNRPGCLNLYRQSRSAARDRGLIRETTDRRINPATNRQQIVWEACTGEAAAIERCPTCGGLQRRRKIAS